MISHFATKKVLSSLKPFKSYLGRCLFILVGTDECTAVEPRELKVSSTNGLSGTLPVCRLKTFMVCTVHYVLQNGCTSRVGIARAPPEGSEE